MSHPFDFLVSFVSLTGDEDNVSFLGVLTNGLYRLTTVGDSLYFMEVLCLYPLFHL